MTAHSGTTTHDISYVIQYLQIYTVYFININPSSYNFLTSNYYRSTEPGSSNVPTLKCNDIHLFRT
jgi:hypothetical protein